MRGDYRFHVILQREGFPSEHELHSVHLLSEDTVRQLKVPPRPLSDNPCDIEIWRQAHERAREITSSISHTLAYAFRRALEAREARE